MKMAGIYSIFIKNSMLKGTWKQYGFTNFEEQINVIFALLLYIMEQSLKEEICTMHDIADFLDELNMSYWKRGLNYQTCKELGDFIINTVLADEGKPMYFQGFNFETAEYEKIHISYIANKIAYTDQDVKRTSYYLTDDGYNLILSTLEIEANLKLTMHEMIFKLHLEKATYDKAAEEMRNIFHMMRIQLQKIQEAMRKIKQNALRYSVEDYRRLLEENLNAIEDTKKRFLVYREKVKERVQEIEERNIKLEKLGKKDLENLEYLKIINGLLNRALEEHQRILSAHFDLKFLYTKELESMTKLASVKRFQIQGDLYELVLENAELLKNIDYFLHPLFNKAPEKTYQINLAFQEQIPLKKQKEEEENIILEEEEWEEEEEKKKQEKLKKYSNCMEEIIRIGVEKGEITLSEMKETAQLERLIPSVEIFKEVMIEWMKNKEIEIDRLKEEQKELIEDMPKDFQLNISLLELIELHKEWTEIKKISVQQIKEDVVVFENIMSDSQKKKRIYCTNIKFTIWKEEEKENGI